jgi:glycine/D-amino acid oxidase-like deaminating enzyme
MTAFDCVIVGAGIHGLCTAFWLQRLGLRRLLVVEQGEPGHTRGSSHGATRITRSSYDDPEFVALAQRAHAEGWPALEQALGPLRVPTPGVFFGPRAGLFAGYARATLQAGVAVEALDVDAARRCFPLLRIDPNDGVLLDHTAAVVLAAETMHGLRSWLTDRGVELRFATPVTALHDRGDSVEVVAANGVWRARHAVLAAGPWTARLAGRDAPPLTVLRQEVGYVAIDAPHAMCAAGAFPVWCRIGDAPNDFHYGLPSPASKDLKIAVHRTAGPGIDPDAAAPAIDAAALLALAQQRFTAPVLALRHTERCLYTMTADQRFHVGSNATRRLTTIAACSGHAFKFGPIVGRMAADLVLAARESRC